MTIVILYVISDWQGKKIIPTGSTTPRYDMV